MSCASNKYENTGKTRSTTVLIYLRCLLSVALSARWRFSPVINTGDARY